MFINSINIDWNTISKNNYLNTIESIRNIDALSFNQPITFFVGENGSGKSTLLEAMAIAEGYNPEGGTKNYLFSTYDSHSELYKAINISRTTKAKWGYYLRAESFYNVATKEDEYGKAPGGKPLHLHEQSHGESFLTIIQNNFNKPGLYFLDEPEAALSPQKQLTLLIELNNCIKQGSQFFIATHSPIILGISNCEILSFDGGRIHPCSYEDTSSYKITSMFINNRQQLLNNLFEK